MSTLTNEVESLGIESAQYLSTAEMDEMNKKAGAVNAPIMESVNLYDPEREFVVVIVEAARTPPNAYMWFDAVPLRDVTRTIRSC